MEEIIKQYNIWIEQLLEEEFPLLNTNCIQLDKHPNNKYSIYDVHSDITIAPVAVEAFNLNSPTQGFTKTYKQGTVSVMRYILPDNIQTFSEFRILFISITLSGLNKIHEISKKSYTDLVVGGYYMTYKRPGMGLNYIRVTQDNQLELRAYSDFVHG